MENPVYKSGKQSFAKEGIQSTPLHKVTQNSYLMPLSKSCLLKYKNKQQEKP